MKKLIPPSPSSDCSHKKLQHFPKYDNVICLQCGKVWECEENKNKTDGASAYITTDKVPGTYIPNEPVKAYKGNEGHKYV